MKINFLVICLCWTMLIDTGSCDISEYFQRLKSDAEMDFFQKMPPQKFGMEQRSPPELDFSDYYDYFGIDPPTKELEINNRIDEGDDDLSVASDVLSEVKHIKNGFHKKTLKVQNSNSRYPYKKRNPVNYHKDNVAAASSPPSKVMTKRISRPKIPPFKPHRSPSRKSSSYKDNIKSSSDNIHSKTKYIANKVQRLVPSKIKTVIEGGGKKIVKTVLQPVEKISNDLKKLSPPKTNQKIQTNEKEALDSWFSPYRTFVDGIAPVFEGKYVTHQLVATWINALASTVVW